MCDDTCSLVGMCLCLCVCLMCLVGVPCNQMYRAETFTVLSVACQDIVLDSAAGTDRIPFRNKEFFGWAIPVLGQQAYQFRFASMVDWQAARIRCVDAGWRLENRLRMCSTIASRWCLVIRAALVCVASCRCVFVLDRYSEPAYVNPMTEFIRLSTNFTNYRFAYRVLYGTAKVANASVLVSCFVLYAPRWSYIRGLCA